MRKKPREKLSRSDVLMDWRKIAEIIGDKEGKPVSRQAITSAHNRMLKKLRYLLLKDPYIKDWVLEHGVEVE